MKWDVHGIKWILVVEKEVSPPSSIPQSCSDKIQATLKALVERNYQNTCVLGKGMIVTAKGYPDLATKKFIVATIAAWKSCECCLHKPVFGLVDCDPDGLNIFKSYQSGTPHYLNELTYAIPELQFLGVQMSEVLPGMQSDEAFRRLTQRDRKLAKNLLLKATTGALDYPPPSAINTTRLESYFPYVVFKKALTTSRMRRLIQHTGHFASQLDSSG